MLKLKSVPLTVAEVMAALQPCPPEMQCDAAVEGLLVGVVTSIDAPPDMPVDAVIFNIQPSQPACGTPYDVLTDKVKEYLAFMRSEGYHPDRETHYLKEIEAAALKMIGGEDVYDEINRLNRAFWEKKKNGQ